MSAVSHVISHDFLKANYEPAEPVNGYIVVELTEKPEEHVTEGGIIVPESAMEDVRNDRPFLIVKKMSKEAKEKFPSLQPGDLIEVMTGDRGGVMCFWGHNMERLGLVDSKFVAGFYTRHSDAAELEVKAPAVPKLKLV